MATVSLVKIKEMAEEYKRLKIQIEKVDEEHKLLTESSRIELEKLKEKLTESFTKTGLPSIRTSDDYLVSYGKRKGVAVTNELTAFKWAVENKAVKIDSRLAGQIIKEMKEIPKGFELVETGYILVTQKSTKDKVIE